MSHAETIVECLRNKSPLCDDCLSECTGIVPRQTINMNCRRLCGDGVISRDDTGFCVRCDKRKIVNFIRGGDIPKPAAAKSKRSIVISKPAQPWPWEGAVQDMLVRHLANEGWTIVSQADTAAKAPGIDIIAERQSRRLWVTVKGFPKGTLKTNPSTQARHWFSHAMFDLVLYRSKDPDVELAAAFPDGFVTYQNLASRVCWLRENMPASIIWIAEDGTIRFDRID